MEDLFKKYPEEVANLKRKGYSEEQILNHLQFQEESMREIQKESMRGIQKDYRWKEGQKQVDNSRSDGR